jgi:hypothetical protein
VLGYAGLVPFVAATWWAWTQPQGMASLALAGYGALIASFLGGIHWGLAMARPRPAPTLLVWGVLPSLVACAALLLPRPTGLMLLAGLLLACYLVDLWLYRRHGLAQWLPLRLRLSVVASLCCALGALAP